MVGEIEGLPYYTYDHRKGWGWFTFNPNLLRRDLWLEHGPYRRFASEREISIYFRKCGLRTIYLEPGVYRHIGDDRHVIDPFRINPKARLGRRLRHMLKRKWLSVLD